MDRVVTLALSDEWDRLQRTVSLMDDVKLHKVVQLASTLESQSQQNRDITQVFQDVKEIKEGINIIATFLRGRND